MKQSHHYICQLCHGLATVRLLAVALAFASIPSPTAGQAVTGVLQLRGNLTGLDQNGDPATYNVVLGYTDDTTGAETLWADSTLSASQLSSFSVAALLTATYNNLESQLPAQLQSDLTLDLAANALDFAFPSMTGQTIGCNSSDTADLTSFLCGLNVDVTGDPVYSITVPTDAPGLRITPVSPQTGPTIIINGPTTANQLATALTQAGFPPIDVSGNTVYVNLPATYILGASWTVDVPEPTSLALGIVGALGLLTSGGWRRSFCGRKR